MFSPEIRPGESLRGCRSFASEPAEVSTRVAVQLSSCPVVPTSSGELVVVELFLYPRKRVFSVFSFG